MERDQWAFGRSRLKSAEDHLRRVKTKNVFTYDGKGKTYGVKFFAVMKEQSQSINKIRKQFLLL